MDLNTLINQAVEIYRGEAITSLSPSHVEMLKRLFPEPLQPYLVFEPNDIYLKIPGCLGIRLNFITHIDGPHIKSAEVLRNNRPVFSTEDLMVAVGAARVYWRGDE